ncbi:MAG: BrnT family toxin [Coprothermobacterota bacterium]|nr:BrnT family toxin [Coprothermobacterota bacterium]
MKLEKRVWENKSVPFFFFLDENAIRFFDPDHSTTEDRFLMLGISFQLRTLVVCHCFRVSNDVIRIFSARKADQAEEAEYWNRR